MKSNAAPQTITAGQVPPYCYRLPGMSAEAGRWLQSRRSTFHTLAMRWHCSGNCG